eukprot:COSAG05_NODE_10_length_39559_cov_64.255423_17_plen_59_part_00
MPLPQPVLWAAGAVGLTTVVVTVWRTHCVACYISCYLFCIGALLLAWLDKRRSLGKAD